MKPNLSRLVKFVQSVTSTPRAAFELAHLARRRLEVAAETASRGRWDKLAAPSDTLFRSKAEQVATQCAASVIAYPVEGEAAVYASLLDAVDVATQVSDHLYSAWVSTTRADKPLPLPPRGLNRLGAPMARGCSRRQCRALSDDENA